MVGGGGGFSGYEPTPLYQETTPGTRQFSAVQYLTPTGYQNVDRLTLPTAWNFNASPSVTTGTGTRRAVPDVSANADPFTGYEITTRSSRPAHWKAAGAAPASSPPSSTGRPRSSTPTSADGPGSGTRPSTGSPQQPGSPFTPLGTTGTSNDNLYYTGTPGQTYNVGTGLGIPDISRLAEDFASQPGGGGRRSGR